MPLINIIRGETAPVAPLNVRTPVVQFPIWAIIVWEIVKFLAWLVAAYVRHWYATVPATGLLWFHARYGGTAFVVLIGTSVLLMVGWAFLHRPSWLRFA